MSVLVIKPEIQLRLGRQRLIFLMTQQFVVTYTIPQKYFRVTGQLGYKHVVCQNAVSTKKIATYIFVKTNYAYIWPVKHLSSFFFLLQNFCPCVTTDCCLMSDM